MVNLFRSLDLKKICVNNCSFSVGPDIQCSGQELLEGETLKERCYVTGNPTPSVKWLKDGKPIDPDVPMSRESAGKYTVKADGASFIQKELAFLVLCKCCLSLWWYYINTAYNFHPII